MIARQSQYHMQLTAKFGKAKAYNNYTVTQAAYRNCSGAFVSQTEWACSL